MNKNVCALRRGMIAELETVNEYAKLMADCDDEATKKIFKSIIEEELIHVGEFEAGIDRLCSLQKEKILEGLVEVHELVEDKITPLI